MRVVNLPQFTETSTIALVNLDTLDCQPVTFNLPDEALKGEADQSNAADKSDAKMEEEEDLIPNEEFEGEL